jgi:uncharacterized protein with von Willebrand factor type A (vWA) domain
LLAPIPYARAYMLLLEGAARGPHAETFVFATRLTRVTKALREGRVRAALERAAAAAPDWAGGTRLGEALRNFNDGFGRRGMARDAVAAALPHVDELVSGHSLAALDAVVEAIGRHR